MEPIQSLIQQQIDYYRARASEYDEWFLRQGRYDHGPEQNKAWFDEVDIIRSALHLFMPKGKVLEIACGTGLWTQQLLRYSKSITAIDAVEKVIDINRARLQSKNINYIIANAFDWKPDEKYDVVFFSFWLSHVPSKYFDKFWKMVAQALATGGRVFFVDSRYETTSTAKDHRLGAVRDETVRRLLNDGSSYQIFKVFYKPNQLIKELDHIGWRASVFETAKYFIYGHAEPV